MKLSSLQYVLKTAVLGSVLMLGSVSALWAGGSVEDRVKSVRLVAQDAGWKETDIPAGIFKLKSWGKQPSGGQPVVRVYIEGDGFAWVHQNQPSMDPTPRNPMALRLALKDPFPNVCYLARPCQYGSDDSSGVCNQTYWTDARFSEEVIASFDQALNEIKSRFRAEWIELVGYSGGGAVAVLVAARRNDIRSIRTVAGNLDPDEVNRIHHASILKRSLNPMNVATFVSRIPQMHLFGAIDKVVPPQIGDRFASAMGGQSSCIQIRSVSDVSHGDGWVDQWPKLLNEPVVCR